VHLRTGAVRIHAAAREVAMNSSLLALLIVIVLIVGSTLSIMNKACKSGYHAWCAPMSTVVYHAKTRPPA
jgi:choline-glycine betaine transporter